LKCVNEDPVLFNILYQETSEKLTLLGLSFPHAPGGNPFLR